MISIASDRKIRLSVGVAVVVVAVLIGATSSTTAAAGGEGDRVATVPGYVGSDAQTPQVGVPEVDASAGATVGIARPDIAVGPGYASGQGITASGQAAVDGDGADARDAAIRAAVTDARAQAHAAVAAAGASLGRVVAIQVFAPLPPEPAPAGSGAGGGSSGSTGGATDPGAVAGSEGAAVFAPPRCSDPKGCVGAEPACDPAAAECVAYQTYASVTITWSLAGADAPESTGIGANGEFSVEGTGEEARRRAIEDAVRDARHQADVAAAAAGVSVGQLVGLQVNAPVMVEPLSPETCAAEGGPCHEPRSYASVAGSWELAA